MLVDYFVELVNVPEEKHISTLEIKRWFHNALETAPMQVEPEIEDDEFEEDNDRLTSKSKPIIKETYLLGQFKLDPVSTDFIGMRVFHTIAYNIRETLIRLILFQLYPNLFYQQFSMLKRIHYCRNGLLQ